MIHQPRTAVHAIGSGKRAAVLMDFYLRKIPWKGLFVAVGIGEDGTFP